MSKTCSPDYCLAKAFDGELDYYRSLVLVIREANRSLNVEEQYAKPYESEMQLM